MSEFDPDNQCYCDSGKPYNACCQPFHDGAAAPTPETLMRSRFSAFVLADSDYLLATWHPDTRPPVLDLSGSPAWASLQVLSASARDDVGKVHFRALYRAGSGWGYLEVNSDFSRIEGRWFYREGETTEGMLKPGRNDRCPCGSGKKYKACCL